MAASDKNFGGAAHLVRAIGRGRLIYVWKNESLRSYWLQLAHNIVQRRAFISMEMKIPFPLKGDILICWISTKGQPLNNMLSNQLIYLLSLPSYLHYLVTVLSYLIYFLTLLTLLTYLFTLLTYFTYLLNLLHLLNYFTYLLTSLT